MSKWSRQMNEYLDLRHRLGFKMFTVAGLLRNFVHFAEQRHAQFVTIKLALQWATEPEHCQPGRWAARLDAVRGFARYLSAADGRTEIPLPGLLPQRYQRRNPYLFTDQQVLCLIQAAQELPFPDELRSATYATLFGLLAVTGMRVGEAIGLRREQVDLDQSILTIQRAKFGKSRLIPLHPSTQRKLREYERLRERVCPQPKCLNFFISGRGTPLRYCTVRCCFAHLTRQIGCRPLPDGRQPRIHDLRHRFTIQTVLHWYRTGVDVEAHLPELTTFLGHRHVTDTYWYLSATPELLKLATQRWERQQGRSWS